MKFKEEKKQGIMGPMMIMTEVNDKGEIVSDNPFQIYADRLGIRFHGVSKHLEDLGELDNFAQAVSRAWNAHRGFIPKITNAAGH